MQAFSFSCHSNLGIVVTLTSALFSSIVFIAITTDPICPGRPAPELFGDNPFSNSAIQQISEAMDLTVVPGGDSETSTPMPASEMETVKQEEEDHRMAEVIDLTMMSDDDCELSNHMPTSQVKPVKQEEEHNPFNYLPDHQKPEVIGPTGMPDDDSEPSKHISASDTKPVKQEEEDSMSVPDRVLPEPYQVQVKLEQAQVEPEHDMAEKFNPVVQETKGVERHTTQEADSGTSKDKTTQDDPSLARDKDHEHNGSLEAQQNQDIRNGPDLASSEVPAQDDVTQQNEEFELLMDDLREYTAKRDKLQAELTKKPGPPIKHRRLKRLERQVQDTKAKLQLIRPNTAIEDLEKEPSLDAKPVKEKNTPSKRHPRTAKEWFERHFRDPKRAAAQRKVQKILFTKPNTVLENAGKRRRSYKGHGKTDAILRRYFTAQSCSKIIEARIALQNLPESETKVLTTQRKQIEQTRVKALENCNNSIAKFDIGRLKEALQSFGLQSRLRNHQLLRVHWMLEKEFGPDKGGILADEIGLGKTIQTLACMVHNKPSNADPKPTLIVVPAASVAQWISEIKKHISPDTPLSTTNYKSSKGEDMEFLKRSDVIITSYQEVQKSFLPSKIQRQMKSKACTEKETRDLRDKHLGDLHKMKFWRVVLDEAHAIKNHDSHTSLSCRGLNAKHRWALSGTPLHNTPLEIWPYLKFLDVPWAGDILQFRKRLDLLDIPTNQEQLQTIIEETMMRRTMSDTILGLPLWETPEIHVEQKWISHTGEEEIIYRIIEARYRKVVNGRMDEIRDEGKKTKLEDIPFCMTYLMRLRQVTAHPFLLGPAIKDTLIQEDYKDMESQISKLDTPTPFFDQIKIFCAEQMKDLGRESGRNPDVPAQVATAMVMSENDDHNCKLCDDELTDPQKNSCGHVFCLSCIHGRMWGPKEPGESKAVCPTCKKELREWQPAPMQEIADAPFVEEDRPASYTKEKLDAIRMMNLTVKEYEDLMADKKQRDLDRASQPSDYEGKDGHKLGNDYLNNQPRLKHSDIPFLVALDEEYPKPMVHSAKTKQVMETVLEWQMDASNDKIIIFVQFIQESMILGRMLQFEGIEFVYFNGQMQAKDKTAAIDIFHQKDEVKVMIASLKCGGVGLNLTCANRVILVDPWWNTPMENQAFGRVYRIGQKKKTYLQSILVKNTIDRRMHDIQKDKVKMIEQAMQHSRGLSTQEAMKLIGNLTKDEAGNTVLKADYED
ncbi:hypothetical protein PG999_009823 [Apiospora kogelbergensis]|uniref:Uncharacterized protein n=1 Tax=Apiospora kogelbergensis TaxID=1337665 RepID=A0AAW0QLR8_9PEZI